jgi:N-acetylmuramoyl-L-alanine amidase
MLRRDILQGAQRIMAAVIVIAGLGMLYAGWLVLQPPAESDAATSPSPVSGVAKQFPPTRTPLPDPNPTATSTPHPVVDPVSTSVPVATAAPSRRVGVVSGHRGYDSGAICSDGLTEAEINFGVAQRVVALLGRMGYTADLLEEYDDRLEGYQANAMVSIHADSCDVPGASGFKVARVIYSAVPEQEDRLVACLKEEYAAATGLSFHANSITYDMREYHAFNEIAPQTPGVIIEIGFMLDDRYVLLFQQDRIARGITEGIVCFLEGAR